MVAAGTSLSVLAAHDTAHDEATADRRAYERNAFETISALRAAILHEEDLVVSTGAVFAEDPEITTSELNKWLDTIRARERYPELLGVAVMRAVTDRELGAFVAQLRDDPATLLGPTDELQIVPPGPRPSYCLLQAVAMTDGGQATVASGVDYCATEVGPHLAAARDSGIPSYLALPVDDGVQLVVQAPIYSGGDDPGSPAVRRARYLGSLGTSISPEVLFANVLHEQDDMTITLTYEDEGSVATFSSGTIDGDTQSVRQ
ncbi:MAG: CHASE domain-containing protein, partial [Ilumatobacteraceae bacterium]